MEAKKFPQNIKWNLSFSINWKNRKEANSLNLFNRRTYSQNGEDGILEFIFDRLGIKKGAFLEIGVESGKECNTRLLIEKGWEGKQFDYNQKETPILRNHFVTAENINNLVKQYDIPKNVDLFSIDIDGNDYWIWRALNVIEPKVISIEYNSAISQHPPMVQGYKADCVWDGTLGYGANLEALIDLAKDKGYTCIGTDFRGVNAFFIRNNLMEKYFPNFVDKKFSDLFNSPKFKLHPSPKDLNRFIIMER